MPIAIPGKVSAKTKQTQIYQQVDSIAEIVLQYDKALNLLYAAQWSYCVASFLSFYANHLKTVIENSEGLDLLTVGKGNIYLKEKCCFYVNQSGIINVQIQQL